MIYLIKPDDFNPRFDIVSNMIVREDGKFLLLQRALHKPQGGTWGIPTGKVESEEDLIDAIIRETVEETGIFLTRDSLTVHPVKYIRVDNDGYDLTYYMFSCAVPLDVEIVREDIAHDDFMWADPKESLNMNLIHDMQPIIKEFFNLV
jgi:8-oxo-dGTP pyrophosphatase MutT (NUDIX family)